ncbi:MAG: hypothetical protein WC548_03420 [Candidatus Pacearchaeota archaeon]
MIEIMIAQPMVIVIKFGMTGIMRILFIAPKPTKKETVIPINKKRMVNNESVF